VVRSRVILTDIDRRKEAIDVRREYFADIRLVDTIMQVTRFVQGRLKPLHDRINFTVPFDFMNTIWEAPDQQELAMRNGQYMTN